MITATCFRRSQATQLHTGANHSSHPLVRARNGRSGGGAWALVFAGGGGRHTHWTRVHMEPIFLSPGAEVSRLSPTALPSGAESTVREAWSHGIAGRPGERPRFDISNFEGGSPVFPLLFMKITEEAFLLLEIEV